MRKAAVAGICTRMRPKFSARVIAPPDSSTVNFAGPQMSIWPPAASAIRACPTCTVTTLPLVTEKLESCPFVPPSGRPLFPRLAAPEPPSTETSLPSTRPIKFAGVCCADSAGVRRKISTKAKKTSAMETKNRWQSLCRPAKLKTVLWLRANCVLEYI